MLHVTEHAKRKAMARLGFQRRRARAKIAWLYRQSWDIPQSKLPPRFQAAVPSARRRRNYRAATYIGIFLVLVCAAVGEGQEEVVTLIAPDEFQTPTARGNMVSQANKERDRV